MVYLVWVFKDKISWVVFLTIFLLSLFGFNIIPQQEHAQVTPFHLLLGILYSLLFGLITTCLFKSLKEKFFQVWKEKKPHLFVAESFKSFRKGEITNALKTFLIGLFKFLVIILGIFGLGAAQFCVLGSPVCTFSVGTAIVTALFPSFLLQFLYEYGQIIIFVAILVQFVGLFFMGCFKKVKVVPTNG